MPVIVSNPRYERLAQCLAAGMLQCDAMTEAGFKDTSYSTELVKTEIIQNRLAELLEAQAQKLINTGAIATLEERKAVLTEILRTSTSQLTPTSPGHVIASAKELNLMERVYTDTSNGKPGIVNITYVFNGLPSAQSTQSLPESPKTIEIEANTSPITAIVRTNEAKPIGKHVYSEEEKKQVLDEIFGQEDKPDDVGVATPPTSDSEGAGA